MNSVENQKLLIEVLKRYANQRFTVTDIRDVFINETSLHLDSAKVRRWVAGKFATFTRRGWLVKESDELRSKDFFTLSHAFWQDRRFHLASEENLSNKTDEQAIKQLSKELEHCKRSIITQLSEIEEYKRIQRDYPELKTKALSRFERVLEENYQLLGRVRALENMMINADEAST
jgi:hypothetical protein